MPAYLTRLIYILAEILYLGLPRDPRLFHAAHRILRLSPSLLIPLVSSHTQGKTRQTIHALGITKFVLS